MEGTKHEKITLVVLGYVIGAVTVFIGAIAVGHRDFHFTKPQLQAGVYFSQMDEPALAEPAAVSVLETPAVETPAPTDTLPVAYFDDALRIADGETKFTLSKLVTEAPTDEAFASQGYHIETPAYTTSENGQFVFFCERHDAAENFCHAFVFDSVTASIYIVQHDENVLTPTLAEAAGAAWDGNSLTIGNFTSADTATPWVVK